MEEQRLIYHYRLFTIIDRGFCRKYKSSDFDMFLSKFFILDSEINK